MTQREWARREVEIACKRENPNWDGESFDCGYSCYMSALKAYECLMGDGHSGYSFSITRSILKKLLDGRPLTPITDEDFFSVTRGTDEWPAGGEDFDRNINTIMLQTNVDSEDRVLLKQEKLGGFHKYIKSIHIDQSKANPEQIHLFQTYSDQYGMDLKIMDHKSFMLGKY